MDITIIKCNNILHQIIVGKVAKDFLNHLNKLKEKPTGEKWSFSEHTISITEQQLLEFLQLDKQPINYERK